MSDQADIHALVAASQLEAISFLELSARRANEEAPHDQVLEEESYDVDPEFTLEIGRGQNGDRFRIRIRTEIEATPGAITVDAAAEYALADLSLSDIPNEVMLDFVNRVAIFAVIPYLRQGIADMTQRVFGTPITMPMYRAGELFFTEPEHPAGN